MPRVVLASQLTRWLQSAPTAGSGEATLDVEGSSVRDVLEHVFAEHPALRGYVLDDQGALRHHVAIFVDGMPVQDKATLQTAVPGRGEVYVMQALSGG